MYKVDCDIYAIMKDGSIGNIKQGKEVFYTDVKLEEIESSVNTYLETKKRFAVITNAKLIEGIIIKKS